jgi:hypothetical protein
MAGRKKWMIGLGILLVGGLAWLVWPEPPPPRISFDLPDGTSIQFISMTYGNTVRFYEGKSWQKVIFKLFGYHVPVWLSGYEVSMPSFDGEPILGVRLRHYTTKGGGLLAPIDDSVELARVDASENKTIGLRWANNSPPPISSGGQVIAEDAIWQFTFSTEEKLHLQYYLSNTNSGTISTNDFFVPNSAYRR